LHSCLSPSSLILQRPASLLVFPLARKSSQTTDGGHEVRVKESSQTLPFTYAAVDKTTIATHNSKNAPSKSRPLIAALLFTITEAHTQAGQETRRGFRETDNGGLLHAAIFKRQPHKKTPENYGLFIVLVAYA